MRAVSPSEDAFKRGEDLHSAVYFVVRYVAQVVAESVGHGFRIHPYMDSRGHGYINLSFRTEVVQGESGEIEGFMYPRIVVGDV